MIRKNLPPLVVILAATGLLIFKWSYLSLPTYWDETYPYSYAVHQMAMKGVTLLPGELPMEVSKGHPLLFHATAATWENLFSDSMFSVHLFALLISIGLLFAVYALGKKIHSPAAGATAAILLATRTVFLVQSSFLLPEMMIALFTVLVIIAWLNENDYTYVLFGTLLLLTKESGIVLMLVLPAIRLVQLVRLKTQFAAIAKKLVFYVLPFLPWILFLVLQHSREGVWFLNEHLHPSLVSSFSFYDIFVKTFCAHLFIYYGGIFSLLVVCTYLIVHVLEKIKTAHPESSNLWTLFIFIAAYLLFCGCTFPIPRYVISALGPWYIIIAVMLLKLFRTKIIYAVIGVIVLCGIQIGYAIDIRRGGDYDFGYIDAVRVHQQAAGWLVSHNMENEKIFAQHVFMRAVSDASSGYVEPSKEFKDVSKNFQDADALVITSYDDDPTQSQAKNLPLKLQARFEQGNTWIELYTHDNEQPSENK